MDDKSKPVGEHVGVLAQAGLALAGYSPAVVHMPEDKESNAIKTQISRHALIKYQHCPLYLYTWLIIKQNELHLQSTTTISFED